MERQKDDILRFQNLIKDHKSANHPVFEILENAAKNDSLTKEMYYIFAVNIATRTMMSLPEIHACCIQASLELDPLRTAYSVMTGAEEGGFGKPNEVHSILMMNALNYHGKLAFGLETINLKYLMSLVRLLNSLKKCSTLLKLESKYSGLNCELELNEFIDKSELIDTSLRMGIISKIEISEDDLTNISKIEKLEKKIYDKLHSANVLTETINYCLAQLAVLGNMKAGYLQGVGFAHEGLADGMINKMFRVCIQAANPIIPFSLLQHNFAVTALL